MTDRSGGMIRYCSPFHGGWDIARMALRIPESHAVFFCPASCARIIALNARKNNVYDRLSVYGLREDEIVMNNYTKAVLESIAELFERLAKRPRVVILFVSCIDSMLGTDHSEEIYELEIRYPDVRFMLMRMNPICQSEKTQQTLFRLQEDIFSLLKPCDKKEKAAAFIGSNVPPNKGGFYDYLAENGVELLHIGNCDTMDEFLKMGSARLNIVSMPYGIDAAKKLKKEMGTDFVLQTHKADYDLFDKNINDICKGLGIPSPDTDAMRKNADAAVESVKKALAEKPVYIDTSAFMDSASWGMFLLDRGINVEKVYVYDANGDKTESALVLKERYPDVQIEDCGHFKTPDKRSTSMIDALAIGMECGCFENTAHTVPVFIDSGYWGYDAVIHLADEMKKALENKCSAMDITEEARICTA